jgi:LysM repeat protein
MNSSLTVLPSCGRVFFASPRSRPSVLQSRGSSRISSCSGTVVLVGGIAFTSFAFGFKFGRPAWDFFTNNWQDLSSKPAQISFTHTVKAGESLSSIAQQVCGSEDFTANLATSNGLGTLAELEIGQVLTLPQGCVKAEQKRALPETNSNPTPTPSPSPSPEPTTQIDSKKLQDRASEFARSFSPGNHFGGLAYGFTPRRHG